MLDNEVNRSKDFLTWYTLLCTMHVCFLSLKPSEIKQSSTMLAQSQHVDAEFSPEPYMKKIGLAKVSSLGAALLQE